MPPAIWPGRPWQWPPPTTAPSTGRWGRRPKVQGIPVSVADCPEECTFFFPAVCTGENLVAGVIGRGDDHARTARAARAIRSALEGLE